MASTISAWSFSAARYNPAWIWKGQWRLDGWQNRYLSVALFLWALWLPTKRGDSVVGVFNRRLDAVVVEVLRKWRAALENSSIWKQLGRT